MRFFSPTIIVLTIMLLPSCGDLFMSDTTTILLSSEDKEWLVSEDFKDGFLLEWSNREVEIFELEKESTSFLSSSYVSMFLVNSYKTDYEFMSQKYFSKENSEFRISLRANDAPQGSILTVSMNHVFFSYDLVFNKLTNVSTPSEAKSLSFGDGEYSDNGISSTALYQDTIEVNNRKYEGALTFTLKDFEEKWQDSTITEIIIAKEIGLISYTSNSGFSAEKKE